jgi:tetratricopeptide (TPR) repeat protein
MLLNTAALALVSGRLWRPLFELRLRPGAALRTVGLLLLALLFAYSAATYAGAALEARGNAARASGLGSEALGAYRAAAAVDPLRSSAPDLAAALLLARFEETRDRLALADAIDAEIEATMRNPFEFRYPERLGLLYAKAAEIETGGGFRGSIYRAGLGCYDRAIALNPHNAALHYRKALLLFAAGADAEGVKTVERLMQKEPRYAKGYVLMGALLERQGRIDEAQAARRQALALRRRYASLAREPYEREFFDFDEEGVAKLLVREPAR